MAKEDTSQASPSARDIKIKMIQDRLKAPVGPAMKDKLERMLNELQGETPPRVTRPAPEKPPESPAARSREQTTAPKRTVKIWTPSGEIEVVRQEPRYAAPKTNALAETGVTRTDSADRDEKLPLEPPVNGSMPAARIDIEPSSVSAMLPDVEVGGRRPTREEERLMLLTGINSLDELTKFLSSPDLGPEKTQSCSPDEVYELAMQEAEEEELLSNARETDSLSLSTPETNSGLWKYVPILGCILALFLAAFSQWPNGFYVLLRLAVCTVSVYWAVEMFKQRQVVWTWALGANAVLFNPVLPIHMARSDWEVINLLDAVFLATWATVSFYKERRKLHGPHSDSAKKPS
jgi:uncharacterized protein DUF6804